MDNCTYARHGLSRIIAPIAGIESPSRAVLALAALTVALTGRGLRPETQAKDRAPRNLLAQVVDGGVELKWSAPTEDAASVEGYEILRCRPNRGEPRFTTLVSDTGDTETTYIDATAIEAGARYTYRVKAIRNGERSGRSNSASVLLLADVVPRPLVGNIGQSPTAEATITSQYTMLFRLGTHGQGYAIDSISIDLAEAPTDLTV